MGIEEMAISQQQLSGQLDPGLARQAQTLLGQDFVRFCLVGALGFLINLAVLFLLHGLARAPLVIAQVMGAELAILSNFFFHSTWTYQNYVKMPFVTRIVKFHAAYLMGGVINSLTVVLTAHYLGLHYALGLVLGSILALGWNFVWSKYHIWAKEGHHQPA